MELFVDLDDASAEFSPDMIYRYTLTRQWDDGKCIGWLCFNPSTATATVLDHSVRKMIGFSRRWGYARLVVLNLYAVRSTDPTAVTRMGSSAVGSMNDYWILKSINDGVRELICAWGCAQHASEINERVNHVLEIIRSNNPSLPIWCLGYRKDGHPRHPLTLGYDTMRVPFKYNLQGHADETKEIGSCS